jgi:hypothetical protein
MADQTISILLDGELSRRTREERSARAGARVPLSRRRSTSTRHSVRLPVGCWRKFRGK